MASYQLPLDQDNGRQQQPHPGQQQLGQQQLGQQQLGHQHFGQQHLGQQHLGQQHFGQQHLGQQRPPGPQYQYSGGQQQSVGAQYLGGHQQFGQQQPPVLQYQYSSDQSQPGQPQLSQQQSPGLRSVDGQQYTAQQQLGQQQLGQQQSGQQQLGQQQSGQQQLGQQQLGQQQSGQHQLGQQHYMSGQQQYMSGQQQYQGAQQHYIGGQHQAGQLQYVAGQQQQPQQQVPAASQYQHTGGQQQLMPALASGPQLPPVPQPIGIFPEFITKRTETLVLIEGMFSLGGSFDVKLANGTPILRVQGKVISITNRKSVYDMSNRHLFDIQKEYLRLLASFSFNTPGGEKIGQLKSQFAFFKTKATATFTSKSGKLESLLMEGDMFDFSTDIVDESNGAIIAQIDRKVSITSLVGQQTYNVIIAPGVDMVLVAAICICLEEKRARKSGRDSIL